MGHARSRRETFTGLETLEPRTLLSADLAVIAVNASKLPATLIPGDKGTISVIVTNQGDAVAKGTINLSVFATVGGQAGPGDVPVGSLAKQVINLLPGKSKSFLTTLVIPPTCPEETYGLSARIDTGGTIPGDDPGNNEAAAQGTWWVTWQFGTTDFRRNAKLTLQDADGSVVTFTIAGAGQGSITPADKGLWDLMVLDTTKTSAITLKVKGGDGRAVFHDISICGPAKSLAGAAVDLTDMMICTEIGSILLHDVTGPASIIFDGVQMPLTFKANEVTDLCLTTISGSIKAITVTDWRRSAGAAEDANVISANSLAALTVKGDFQASLDLAQAIESKGAVLGQVTVKGNLSGAIWLVNGPVTKISAGSVAADWHASITGTLGTLTVAGNFEGVLGAANFTTVTIGGDMVNAWLLAGADLGADAALDAGGPVDDVFRAGNIGTLTIKLNMDSSTVAAGIDPVNGVFNDGDDEPADGTGGKIGSLTVGKTVSDDSYIGAGTFKRSPSVAGHAVSPSLDPRFVQWLPKTEAGEVMYVGIFSEQYEYYPPPDYDHKVSGAVGFRLTLWMRPLVTAGGVRVYTITKVMSSDPQFGAQMAVPAGAGSAAVVPYPPRNISDRDGEGFVIVFPNGATVTTNNVAGAMHEASGDWVIGNSLDPSIQPHTWTALGAGGSGWEDIAIRPGGYNDVTHSSWDLKRSAL
jgi:hypothetical protein